METWKAGHPDWSYMLWTEEEISELGLYNQTKFESHPMLSGKADIARYEILFKFGGFFIDADSISIKPLDDLLDNNFVTVYESEKNRKKLVANGYFGCKPKNRVMFDMINEIRKLDVNRMMHRHAWETTGPLPFTTVLKKHSVKILDSETFIPVHFEDKNYERLPISSLTEDKIQKIKQKHPGSYSYQFWGSKSDY